MSYRSERRRVRSSEIHLLRGGRGSPLLVLHPEFASGRWFPYHDQLAARFQVFAPDHPGFGQSERPEWVESVQDLAFFYLDLLDELGLDEVAVLGVSFGGWLAAELAVLAPHRVTRLALVGPAGLRVENAERYDLFARPLEETLQRLFHQPGRWIMLLPNESGPEVLVNTYREATMLARVAWNPYWYDPKLRYRLHRITVPTLILWGAHDRFLSVKHGEAYVQFLPYARLELVPESGHFPLLEQPEFSLSLLLPFLQS